MPAAAILRLARPLLVGLALLPAAVHAERSDWRQLSVRNIRLYSVLGESATRSVALQLQTFEQTVGQLLQSEDRLADVPTLIYILNRRDFEKYTADRNGISGFFAARPYQNLIVINGDEPLETERIIVCHEYTHFIQRASRTMVLPPWFVEGYAELFSSFRISKDRVVTRGDLAGRTTVSIDPQAWIPMERLLAVKQADAEYRTERLMPKFYGAAWALVHMLVFDDKTLRAPTYRYLQTMDLGLTEPEAFKNAFPFDKAGLDKALRLLLHREVIHVLKWTLPAAVSVDQMPITRVNEAQADAESARLLFRLNRPNDVVLPLVAAALKQAPADPGIRALAARVATHAGEPATDVGDLATLFAQGGGGDADLRTDVAATLVTRTSSEGSLRQAVAILDELVHTERPPIEAIMLWVGAATRAGTEPARVRDVLEPAAVRAPHSTLLLSYLARVSQMLHDKPRARDYYPRIILVSADPNERLWAQKLADSAELQDDPPPGTDRVGPAAPYPSEGATWRTSRSTAVYNG